MKKVSFEVEGQVKGKGRPRFNTRTARTYTPQETVIHENYIRMCFKAASTDFFSNEPLSVSITAWYRVPQSWSQKKQKQALEGQLKPCVKPDADNVIKIVLDALDGLAYSDDKKVVTVSFSKVYGEKPGLKVTLEEV